MELTDPPVLAALVVGGVVVLVTLVVCLVDLARHEVRHLPKWAWALVILFVSFPVGPLLYLVVGRVPHAERRPATPPVPAAAAPGGTAPAVGPGPEASSSPVAGADPDAVPVTAPSVPDRTPPPSPPSPGVGSSEAAPAPAVLRTHGLGKRYGDADALADVDLAVPRGVIYGLIGPNGAGKTTLLSILAGLRRPTAGRVELDVDRRSIGVLVDTPTFEPWLTAHEVVDLARHLTAPDLPRDRVIEVLDATGLADAVDRRVGGFSRGMLQRLGLAACLVGDPELLMLDEPSSALDPAGRREVLDLIGRLAHTKTVLLSTHILSDVQQVCDVVGVIDHGRLRFQGPLADLLARTSTIYAVHVRGAAGPLLADLRERPWAQQVVEQAPGRLRVVVADAGAAERELPRLVAAHDRALVSLAPVTDLETAFLELTS